MKTLDTEEGQKEFAARMALLINEFGGDCAAWIVSDKNATPKAFGVAGTNTAGGRELLCRAVSISYDCDAGEISDLGGGIRMSDFGDLN
jgi:hypothetical protein